MQSTKLHTALQKTDQRKEGPQTNKAKKNYGLGYKKLQPEGGDENSAVI
jgi:hypothetical protein